MASSSRRRSFGGCTSSPRSSCCRTPGTSRARRCSRRCPAAARSRRRAPRSRASLGFEDGEQAPRDGDGRGRRAHRARPSTLPVTADLEAGYGDPVGTARAAWDAGLVGINFEDSPGDVLLAGRRAGRARSRAIRAAVPDARHQRARRRVPRRRRATSTRRSSAGTRTCAPGADCVYPILCPPAAIAELARPHRRADQRPADAESAVASRELQTLGVARVTWGGGLARARVCRGGAVAAAALSGE